MTATQNDDYESFIRAKIALAPDSGFEPPLPISDALKPHQADVVRWSLRKGRAGIFLAFGLGKTRVQLEIARQVCAHVPGGSFLLVAPLGVRVDFARDAAAVGVPLTFIRRTDEVTGPGVYLTNYESVREGKVDPSAFVGASLDEASILRGFGGTKTFREAMATFAGDDRRDMSERRAGSEVEYRFVASATPSPNDFIELLAYAAFLGVMDVSTAKTRFFQRDSEKADELTLHPHKEREFWLWVSSWATFVSKPSDLGHSDEGYALPELVVEWHEVATDHAARTLAKLERDAKTLDQKAAKARGKKRTPPPERPQRQMFADAAAGISDAAREARESLPDRVAKLLELRERDPGAHRIIWHDLEAEREALEAAIPGLASVYGSQSLEDRERIIEGFADGTIAELAAKPVMLGSGCNFQRHCAEVVFLSVGYKFNGFIQAIHRVYRFLQTRTVTVRIIYTEAQRAIRRALEEKWAQHRELTERMGAIIREFGLDRLHAVEALRDRVTCVRQEASGEGWRLINNDTIDETRALESSSVGLVVTSVPFANQYKYSESYRDLGHSDTAEHFWSQMDFHTPELLRVLKPGRLACIHVKDRVVPGGMTGLGFSTVYPFHVDAIRHYTRHGFAYMGMVTVVTDVVRENNQTYRLGWSDMLRDGTTKGVGLPEYVLLFRRPPTSAASARADDPVVKTIEEYSLGRWQVDARGDTRSSGDRLLTAAEIDAAAGVGLSVDELAKLPHAKMFQVYREHSRRAVYDYAEHIRLNEGLGALRKLPTTFTLLQPQSWSDLLLGDVVRMRTANAEQAAQDRVQHLCPLPFDLAQRFIHRYSSRGDLVFDPFSGLGTVPKIALRMGRRGLGTELSPVYFSESVRYLVDEERRINTPTLFDWAGLRAPAAEEVDENVADCEAASRAVGA